MLNSRIARRSRHVWLTGSIWNRRIVFIVGAGAVGLAAVLFAVAATYANLGIHEIIRISPWLPLIITPLGFALLSWITTRFFPGTQGSGIPQTIAAFSLPGAEARTRLLSLRIAISKIGLTLAGLLTGASIGREGPTVQVGASIMHALSRTASFPHEGMKRGLILAGGAAGVAAAFNAPLAGVVFAIEEMSRSFEQRTSVIVLVAVVVAGIVAMVTLGNYAYFGQTTAVLELRSGWPAVALCGLTGGLLGGGFSRVLIALSRSTPEALARLRHARPHVFAGACGLAVALLGLLSGDTIYGTGYEETRAILDGADAVQVTFGPLKLLATIASYASGIPGGIFSPSLAIGAGFGYDISLLLPQVPLGGVVTLGMVGYFSGVVQAPITAFVIVTEMTRNADMALPLMACSLIAYGFSRLVCSKPIYKALAEQFKQ